MIEIPSNIDPYADENIKKLSNSSFCEDIFNKVFDYVNEPGYHSHIKRMRDLKNSIDTALQDGRIKAKIEIAKKCLRKRMSIEDITELTGLTKDEIEDLNKYRP